MDKKGLIDKVAYETSTNKKMVEDVFNSIFTNLSQSIKTEKRVQVPGFGIFKIVERKQRTGINPRTKEKITIDASISISFKPAKSLKEDLN